MRVLAILLVLPAFAWAAETCPWLNAATAGGVLGGRIANVKVMRAQTGTDASCEFAAHAGSILLELRIEVETMPAPALDFAAYESRCHSAAAPLTAIGTKAVACSDDSGGQLAEQVIGRVRDRAFVVRISTSDHSTERGVERDKAKKIAEQVAGILF